MGETDRIECHRLGGHRAFLGGRWIGAGKKDATRRRREHPRRRRNRGSYDLGTALLDAALPGKLRQRGEVLATSGNPTSWNAGSSTWTSKRSAHVAATGRNVATSCRVSPINHAARQAQLDVPMEFWFGGEKMDPALREEILSVLKGASDMTIAT